jgi:hypothetical protein
MMSIRAVAAQNKVLTRFRNPLSPCLDYSSPKRRIETDMMKLCVVPNEGKGDGQLTHPSYASRRMQAHVGPRGNAGQ